MSYSRSDIKNIKIVVIAKGSAVTNGLKGFGSEGGAISKKTIGDS